MDLNRTDPAQHLMTAVDDLDDLDHDLSDLFEVCKCSGSKKRNPNRRKHGSATNGPLVLLLNTVLTVFVF